MAVNLLKTLCFCFLLFPLYSFEQLDFIGEINYPQSDPFDNICVDSVGRIYLTQKGKTNIAVYNKLGSQIDVISLDKKNSFARGGDLMADKQGNLYFLDTAESSLKKINSSGTPLFSVGKKGSNTGDFRGASAMTLDENTNIYTADTGNCRIQIFNSDGIYIQMIDSGSNKPKMGNRDANLLTHHEKFSRTPISKTPVLKSPSDIALDREGFVFVLDSLTRFIVIYDSTGQYMGNIDLNNIRGLNDAEPTAIAVDGPKIYVLDKKYHNIKIFNRIGEFLQEIGTKGTGRGQFFNPKALCITNHQLYILDSGNNRIQIFGLGEKKKVSEGEKDDSQKEWTDKPHLAVFDFSDSNKASQDRLLGNTVSEMLTTSFVQSGKFALVERKEIQKIIEDIEFDKTGMVSDDSAKKIGKLLGVDFGVFGGVSVLNPKIELDARLLDMKTGLLITAVTKSASNENRLRDVCEELVLETERTFLNRVGAPSSPKGLFAMPSINSIFLRWEANKEDDILNYMIFQSEKPEGPFVKITETSKPEHEFKNLPENKVLYYKIIAVDSEGKESPPSDIMEARTKNLPHFGYTVKVKTELLSKKVRFSWTNPEDEALKGYQIFRSDLPGGKFTLVGTAEKKFFEDAPLEDGKEYFYRIKKIYANGLISDFSNVFSCLTDAVPTAVDNFEAVSDLARRIELRWTLPPQDRDIARLVLYRSDSSEGKFEELKKLSGFKKVYTDSGLTDNTTYYYKIKSIDKFGLESPLSGEIFATTKDIPKTSLNISAESHLPRKVRLSWIYENKEKNILFIIHRSESSDGTFKELAKTNTEEYTDLKLGDNQTYYYFITAKDKDGLISEPSEIVEATTKSLPVTPANFKAMNNQPQKVTLLWEKNPEPDIDYYLIYGGTSAKGFYHKIAKSKATVYVHNHEGKGLKNGENYYYKLTAVDTDGLESPLTSVVTATTKPLPPSPQNVVVEYKEPCLLVSWPPVEGKDIHGYNVYKNGKKMELIKSNLWVDNNVKPGTGYYYHVSTVDNDQLESRKSERVSYRIQKPGSKG